VSAQRLSDRVRLVRANNPSAVTLDGTNTWIVGERDPVVIDPGPDDLEHLEAVLEEAGPPSLVVLTHRHPDHAAGAERFAAMARAPLAAHSPGAGHADILEGAAPISDGQRIDADGAKLVAVFTPGHARDHLAFFLEEERALFTGDHVLGRGTTVIAWPDGDLTDYMRSLEKARALDAARVFPGHGPVIDDPAPVLDYYIAHRLEREQQVIAALDSGDREIPEIVARIYAAYDPALHAVAALSVRAHLEKLLRDGRVARDGEEWRLA
jgi:glyoxylase-like metal-dependent hydrolase (beta-lactamase superfamily II)